MSHVEILERVFPMQKRSVLMAALSQCQGDLAKTIDHFITLGDNMVSIQNQLQSDVTSLSSSSSSSSTTTITKSAFTPITATTTPHQNGPSFDFRPSIFFSPQTTNHQTQRENHLPLLPPPPPPLPPTHQFPGLYPSPVNFLHHFAQTHPVALAAAYEKLLKRHQQETAAAAAATKTGDR
jgi:hypothetical protein